MTRGEEEVLCCRESEGERERERQTSGRIMDTMNGERKRLLCVRAWLFFKGGASLGECERKSVCGCNLVVGAFW